MIGKMVTETRSPEETYELGRKIGLQARPGQVYTLTGDLGVGKTILFAKGDYDYGKYKSGCNFHYGER